MSRSVTDPDERPVQTVKIHEATNEAKPLDVKFGASVLKIEYTPLSYTIREMRKVADSKDPVQIAETIKRLVNSWDLESADGLVPLDHSRDEDDKVKDDDPLLDIPSHIFTGILKAVAEDQSVSGEAGKPSRAS